MDINLIIKIITIDTDYITRSTHKMRRVYGRGLNIVGQIDKSMVNYRKFTPIQQLDNYKLKGLGCGYLQSYYLLEDEQLIKAGHYMDSLTSTRILNFYRIFPKLYKSLQFFIDMGKLGRLPLPEPQFLLINKEQALSNIHFKHYVIGSCGVHLFDEGNNMYTIGQNYYGQRGTGDQKTNESELRKIQYLQIQAEDIEFNKKKKINKTKQQNKLKQKQTKFMKQKIVDVALGFQHTVIITQNGELYGCGKAEAGQIQPAHYHHYKDIVSLDKILVPQLIWSKRKVIRAACGYKHTIFQTQDGKLYGLGLNRYGQCGVNYLKNQQLRSPVQIFFPALEGQKVVDIKCGMNHTLILTNFNLYFMGNVQSNQNPFSIYNQNVSSPSIMNLPSRPIKIFTNFDRSAIITEDGKAYIFGGKNLQHREGQSGKLQVIEDHKFSADSLIGLGFSHTIIYP